MSHSTNFATNIRWLASLPFSTMFPNESDVKLNITQFDIPDINIGSFDVSYQGYTIAQPTGLIQPDDKTCTFSYLLDTDMTVYWLLYKWAGFFTDNTLQVTKTSEEESGTTEPLTKKIPISVFILDEFKNPILKITYHDCWIQSFGQLSMSYQDSPTELPHSFTVAYSRFDIERVTTTS